MKDPRYQISIQWSNDDNCFLVSLPDFKEEQQWITHGDTYQEALENAVEVMKLLIEIYQEKGKALPKPAVLQDSVA